MQDINNDMKIKSKFKKNLVWILILLFILTVTISYNFILKDNIKDLRLLDYFKHPDKIQAKFYRNGATGINNILSKYLPFYNQKEDKNDLKIEESNEKKEIIEPLKQEIIKQVEFLNDEEALKEDTESEKQNFSIDFYKLSLYKYFLSDVQGMLIEFAQDKPYEHSINKVKFFIKNLPDLEKEIAPIISKLEKYNQEYLIIKPEYKESIIPEYKIIKKFIKIEKDSPAFIEKEKLKFEIYKNLDNLRNILYSNKTEQMFLNSSL